MPHTPVIADSPTEVGDLVAQRIADAMAERRGERFLLGCPTGRTPAPLFEPLAGHLARHRLDPGLLTVVLMDEYLTGDLQVVDPAEEYSCVGYAQRFIVAPIRQACGVPPVVWHADPGDPAAYDRRIADAGGIDLFLLASGASDGHIAFNQPGSERTSITRIIELGEKTRQDNVATWPSLTSTEQVPTLGIGVGISTIVDLSRQAIMMLTGTDKRLAFHRIVTADAYQPDWPATAVKEIENHTIVADRAAVGDTTH